MIKNNTDDNNYDQMPNLNKKITRDEIKALVPDTKKMKWWNCCSHPKHTQKNGDGASKS